MNKAWILALVVIGSVAVTGTAMGTDSPAASTDKVSIELRSPQEGAVIQQNDPASGCAFSPNRGYGLRIDFAWRTKHKHLVTAYHLVASLGASIPIVNVTIADT